MLLPFVFQVNNLRVLGTPQLLTGELCSRSAQEGLASSFAPLWTRQATAPFGGKPSAVIYALSPSDVITAMCSTSATWELQLEHAGAALLRALAVQYAPALLSTCCPFACSV